VNTKKIGEWWLYFGNEFTVIGNSKLGYDVACSEDLREVTKDNYEIEGSGWIGHFRNRPEAIAYVNLLEKAFREGKDVAVGLEGDIGGSVALRNPDWKGRIAIYPLDKLDEAIHELSHIKRGHFDDRRSTWTHEVEAVSDTIKVLQRFGKYTKARREDIISSLATYGTKKKAREAVEQIEKGFPVIGIKLPMWLQLELMELKND